MDHLLARRVADVPSSVIRDLLSLVDAAEVRSLAGGLPPTELLPAGRVAEVGAAVATDGASLQYGPTEGDETLRAWVAGDRLAGSGDPSGDPSGAAADGDVVITHGSQQALDLLVRVLVDPGDVVVVEQPTYLGWLQALAGSGARVVPIPTDADGLDPDALAAELRRGLRPTLAYLSPTYQNPSGSVMPAPRRAALGELAARYGFVVVDDDPYRELGFEGAPPPRLRSFVPPELAVTVGTASKTIAPGLRVGWVHLPAWLRGPVIRAKQAADLHTSTFAQRLVAGLVADAGWYAGHCASLRAVLSERAGALTGALERELGAAVAFAPVRGGMFVWVTFRDVADTDALLRVALGHGVAFVPGSAFDPERRRGPQARLSFATLPAAELGVAVAALGAAARSVGTGGDLPAGRRLAMR